MEGVPVHGMNRRNLLPGLLAGMALAALTADAPRAVRGGGVAWRLVYVGADDCAPCRTWRASNWTALRASPVFAPFVFAELRATRSADLLRDDHWPEHLRFIRDAIPPDAAVPLWFLLRDSTITHSAWGERGWRMTMLPALRRALDGQGEPRITRNQGESA